MGLYANPKKKKRSSYSEKNKDMYKMKNKNNQINHGRKNKW
jgi:hypothetical protein